MQKTIKLSSLSFDVDGFVEGLFLFLFCFSFYFRRHCHICVQSLHLSDNIGVSTFSRTLILWENTPEE